MQHMPYERMNLADGPDDEPTEKRASPGAADEQDWEPKRTPLSAEGGSESEREMPGGEPGRTPGSAEGEDFDEEPSRR
jgi:hypothetical protein